MNERRELRRRRLVHSIELYDRASERFLGKGVDVTTRGLLLIAETPVPQDTEMQLRMTLPERMFGKDHIDLDAVARWRSAGVPRTSTPVSTMWDWSSPGSRPAIRRSSGS
ncbi:MAG: hypothetical protein Q7U96_01135 [Chloroflexota bacterium]|nr:hypothetical protein [Chloroflexota bacterium]